MRFVICATAFVIVAGCNNIGSVRTKNCGQGDPSCVGVVYYLPMNKTSLTIKRTLDRISDDLPFHCVDLIQLNLEPAEPDLRYQFTAQLRHSLVSSDKLLIGVNQRGLLDSRPNDAGLPMGRRVPILSARINVDAVNCAAETFAHIYDPTVNTTIKLPAPYLDYRLNVFASPQVLESEIRDYEMPNRVAGLVYRRSLPYLFTLEQCSNGSCAVRQAAQAMLSNHGTVAVLPFSSTPFSRDSYKGSFVDGNLTNWNANRPSEVIEIVKIPLELLNTVIAVPRQIVSSVTGV